MMNLWLYFLMLPLVLSLKIPQRANNDTIQEIFERKCLKKGGSQLLAEFKTTSEEGKICNQELRDLRSERVIYEIDPSAICFGTCLEAFRSKAVLCLQPTEKSLLQQFLYNLCDGGFLTVKKKVDLLYMSCQQFGYGIIPLARAICMPKLKLVNHKPGTDFLITKPEICSDLKTLHDCTIREVVSRACRDLDVPLHVINNYTSALFEPVLQWCSGHFITF